METEKSIFSKLVLGSALFPDRSMELGNTAFTGQQGQTACSELRAHCFRRNYRGYFKVFQVRSYRQASPLASSEPASRSVVVLVVLSTILVPV